MCQLREEDRDLRKYSILQQLLSTNQTLFYKVGGCGWAWSSGARPANTVIASGLSSVFTPKTMLHNGVFVNIICLLC
jgi:hypothetical protein